MWKCTKCGEQIEDDFEGCWNCGTGKDGSPPSGQQVFEEQKRTLETEAQREQLRYPALRVIAGIYRVLAWFVAILAAIGVFVGLTNLEGYRASFGILLLLGSLIGGAIGFVTLLAASEGIKVFIDIEENTRVAASSVLRKRKK
jgi:predicted  nucleic acid-binding Zn-ribbon protein